MKRLTVTLTVLVGLFAIALGVVASTGPADAATRKAAMADTGARTGPRLYWSYDCLLTAPATLPVLTASTVAGLRTLYSLTLVTQPGDVVALDARAHVTDDLGKNVGVGYHLWVTDIDTVGAVAVRVGDPNGYDSDNVIPARHHMPISTTGVWQAPLTWPAGHRALFEYRVNAFSSAATVGNVLTVDVQYGLIRAWQYGGDGS